jgi:hypothetical protein
VETQAVSTSTHVPVGPPWISILPCRKNPANSLPTGKQRTEVVVIFALHHLPPAKKPRSFPGIEAETPISEPPFRQNTTAQANCCSSNLHFLPILSTPYQAPLSA